MNQKESALVLVTEGSDQIPLDWLAERVKLVSMATTDPQFAALLAQAEGLLVRTYTRVNSAFLDGAPRLKVVGRGGVGLENIDVKECRRRGIEVVFTPDANTLAVGDFVFGYLLQLLRPWAFFKEQVYPPKEFKRIRDTVRGKQLNELTIGILGLGRVGKRVGHIAANGFGMQVIFNDLLPMPALDFPAKSVEKRELYEQSDILTLHVDMKPGNENLVGREQLALLKPGAVVINTCRGEVLDVNALAEALRAKKVFAAAIDVFAPEPPPADFPLLGLGNVLLTPHLAARTYTALENMSWVVRDVKRVLDGQQPEFPAPR